MLDNEALQQQLLAHLTRQELAQAMSEMSVKYPQWVNTPHLLYLQIAAQHHIKFIDPALKRKAKPLKQKGQKLVTERAVNEVAPQIYLEDSYLKPKDQLTPEEFESLPYPNPKWRFQSEDGRHIPENYLSYQALKDYTVKIIYENLGYKKFTTNHLRHWFQLERFRQQDMMEGVLVALTLDHILATDYKGTFWMDTSTTEPLNTSG